jgi:hypothetical protein
MSPSPPNIEPPHVNADTDATQGGLGPVGEALQKHFGPKDQPAGRTDEFETGGSSSRWPGGMAGTAEDAAEGAVEDLGAVLWPWPRG